MESRFIGPGENPFRERNAANAERYRQLYDAGKARKTRLEEGLRERGIPMKEPRVRRDPEETRASSPIFVHGTDHLGRRRR